MSYIANKNCHLILINRNICFQVLLKQCRPIRIIIITQIINKDLISKHNSITLMSSLLGLINNQHTMDTAEDTRTIIERATEEEECRGTQVKNDVRNSHL